jgi:hypothetical protein
MNPNEYDADEILDRTLAQMREDTPGDASIDASAAKVWSRIAGAQPVSSEVKGVLQTCADFQALLPEYMKGALPEARALLVKDHTHECVACRKALERIRGGRVVAMPDRPGKVSASLPVWRWAAAAGVMVVAGLSFYGYRAGYLGPSAPSWVEAVDGTLYRLSGDTAQPLKSGERVSGRIGIRTGQGGALVRLSDGSTVELNERTEFALSAEGRDATVRLERGSIIVQAAKRSSGHLFVSTRDCRVAVTGTIFSVNQGTKGSRVSVIEGGVKVAQGSSEKLLGPGDQFTTSASLGAVPVTDEIAWSRNSEQYLALLKEFAALGKKLEEVKMPGMRYSSRIAGVLPETTVLFVALPNLGQTLSDAHRIFREQLRQSAALRQWWDQEMSGEGAEQKLEESIQRVRSFSDYLGDEIVIAVFALGDGRFSSPVVIAEAARPGLRGFLQAELAKWPGTRLVDQPAVGSADRHTDALFLLRGAFVAVAPQESTLARVATYLDQPGASAFTRTAFHQRIAQSYRNGASILLSADLEALRPFGKEARVKHRPLVQQSGLNDLRYVVVEQREATGQPELRAEVTFTGERRGLFSWLAEPHPLGSLEFISPEASLASAFAVKNPVAAIEDLFKIGESQGKGFREDLARAESQLGFSLRDDFAASLGGEIAFAMDGPALPVPSWKLVVEVYDPVRLQSAIEKLIQAYSREAEREVTLERETAGGQTFYIVRVTDGGPLLEAQYVFTNGYLIAAPNRALLTKATEYRASGYTLARSAQFQSLLPRDRHNNCSAVVYHNLGGVLGTIAGLAPSVGLITPQQQQSLEQLSKDSKPSLVCAYGEKDKILVASNANFFLGAGLSNMLGLPFSLHGILEGPRRKPASAPQVLSPELRQRSR